MTVQDRGAQQDRTRERRGRVVTQDGEWVVRYLMELWWGGIEVVREDVESNTACLFDRCEIFGDSITGVERCVVA